MRDLFVLQNGFFRAAVSVVLFAAPFLQGQCQEATELPAYSICLPKEWKVIRKDPALNWVLVCNKISSKCIGKGAGGFPLPGAVWVSLQLVKDLPGQAPFHNAWDIVSSAPPAGRPAPPISEVRLDATVEDADRKCFLTRYLIVPPGVWDETYGLSVQGRLIEVMAQYGNELGSVENYQAAVKAIISSVRVGPRRETRR